MHLRGKAVVIAGGSGFLGTSLASHLVKQQCQVTVLSRSKPKVNLGWEHVQWDGRTVDAWLTSLDGAHAIVNLAGRTVDCIKTPEHCDEILRSRVESTRALGLAIRQLPTPPPVWVQMSTAHIYGDPPSTECVEDSPLGYGLAPEVGKAWEGELAKATLQEQRVCVLRTSFVIGRNVGAGGGALARLRWVTRLGLGGKIGSGKQGMSWIHELDMNRIVERALSEPTMQGVYIASSPSPVPQVEFMRALRRVLRMPIGLPATAWMVRLGAHWILHTDPELALYGRFVLPERLLKEGFDFKYPDLPTAFRSLCT